MNFRWLILFLLPVFSYSQDGVMMHCNCEGAECDTVLMVFNYADYTELRVLKPGAELSYCFPEKLPHYKIKDSTGNLISETWHFQGMDSVIRPEMETEIYKYTEKDQCVISIKNINSKEVSHWNRKDCYRDDLLISSTICNLLNCETVVNTYNGTALIKREHWILDSGAIPVKAREEHFIQSPDNNGVIISIIDKDDKCQSIFRLSGIYFNP